MDDDDDDDLHIVVGGSSGEGGEDSLAALAALADATTSSQPAPQRVRRRASLSDMTPPLPSSSLLNRAHRRPSCASLDGWVAHGVDFSSSVEVYVFRK